MSLLTTLLAGAALAAGGTVFNVAVTESVTVADTQSAQAVFAPAISESGSTTDAQAGVVTYVVTRTEAGAVADTVSATVSKDVSVSESVSAADSISAAAVFVGARPEVLTAVDVGTATATFVAALTETGSAADSQSAIAVFPVALTDSLSAADTETGIATFAAALTESLAAADTEDATVSSGSGTTYNDSVAETLSSTDTAVASADFVASVSESGTVAETIVGEVLSTPPPFVPELGAGSRIGGSGGGMEAYAASKWAEYDRRKGRKPIDSIVAPVKQPKPPANAIVAPTRRVVTVLEPVDLDEHDRALEQLVAAVPEVVEPAPSLVVVEPELPPSGYTQAAFDALQLRKQIAREHSEAEASQRQAIFDRLADRIEPADAREVRTERALANLFKKHERPSEPTPVNPVAMATRVAEAHRKEVREAEARAWKIYGYLFQLDRQANLKGAA